MIYTLTVNPAIDIKIIENKLAISAGGKGINVSRVLINQGIDNVALGFLGGEAGDKILNLLDRRIKHDFVRIKDLSRRNIKLTDCGKEMEFNSIAPNITEEEKGELFCKLRELKEDDFLIMSGSVPKCLGDRFYEEVIQNIRCKFIVDAIKENLLNCLKYHPELIKPNNFELQDLFHIEIKDLQDVKHYASKLLEMGAKRVLVSLGSDGSYFLSRDNELFIPSKNEKVISTTGAGDSMVAGFTLEYMKTHDEIASYKKAIECAEDVCFKGSLL